MPDRGRKFYAELFGSRTSADPAIGGYALVDTAAGEGAIGGGIDPWTGPEDRPGVRVCVRVDDLDAYLDRAEKLGGRPLVPATDLPGDFGRFAMFVHPDGNPVGCGRD